MTKKLKKARLDEMLRQTRHMLGRAMRLKRRPRYLLAFLLRQVHYLETLGAK